MKILITGGHITPALAVIDELLKKKDIEICFVGRKYALLGDTNPSFEYDEVKKRQIKFIDLQAGRLSLTSLQNLLLIPRGFIESYLIIKRGKPDVVLSFGGYIALPVALSSRLLNIPVFTHEQVLVPGITNKIIARFAKKVFISFPQSAAYFNKKNIIVTGDPLRNAIFTVSQKPFAIEKNEKKCLYVTGGSLGSHAINMVIYDHIDELLNNFIIIHQCGGATEYGDFQTLSEIKKPGYYVRKHFSDDEIGYIYDISDIVVSRAGANTIMELIALQKPAVLIPLPIARNNEQEAHAKLLSAVGAAEIVNQNEINGLVSTINKVAQHVETYIKGYEQIKELYKKDSSKKIISEILNYTA